MNNTKVIRHPFSLDLYHKAKANPDKYSFVYRDGTKPLGVVWMEGTGDVHEVASWCKNQINTHTRDGYELINEIGSSDLFIEGKLPRTAAEIEAEIAALQEELKQVGGNND
jgi:hypothetical protein